MPADGIEVDQAAFLSILQVLQQGPCGSYGMRHPFDPESCKVQGSEMRLQSLFSRIKVKLVRIEKIE